MKLRMAQRKQCPVPMDYENNIIKMPTLSKTLHGFNKILMKTPMSFFLFRQEKKKNSLNGTTEDPEYSKQF